MSLSLIAQADLDLPPMRSMGLEVPAPLAAWRCMASCISWSEYRAKWK